MTSQLTLWKSNHVTIYRFLNHKYFCVYKRQISIVCDIFKKNRFTIGQNLTENVRSSFKAKIYEIILLKMVISLVFTYKELIIDLL